jgi:hypothetical protein
MCCRISTTGFATRTIAGLYIFLATFLIGFFAVQAVSWTDSYLIRRNHALSNPHYNIDDTGALEVIHVRTDMYEKSAVTSIFRVTNTSSERIYFGVDKETYKMPGSVSVIGPDLITETSIEVTNRELAPGESGELWIHLPSGYVRDVTFSYRLENRDGEQTMTLYLGD